ncbi:MAG TPA: hypothetical protein VMY98_10240 [Anaerolineae bacterium]|nr:hypothetical protein [Anaerolineae bacterium]
MADYAKWRRAQLAKINTAIEALGLDVEEREMKVIINGKRYSTATATELAVETSRCGRSDFALWREGLYRTPKGAYFLAGLYRAASGGSSWGDRLTPITREEAIEWLERYELFAELEEHFADTIEDA